MLDGKMRTIVSGRGGTYCPQCDCTAASYVRRGDGRGGAYCPQCDCTAASYVRRGDGYCNPGVSVTYTVDNTLSNKNFSGLVKFIWYYYYFDWISPIILFLWAASIIIPFVIIALHS